MVPGAKYWQSYRQILTQGCLQKFKISVEIFGVIDCHHGQSHVDWNVSHTYCVIIFLWFHTLSTFQPCIWMYYWIETCLYRMLWKIWDQIWYHPIHGYWHHIFTSEIAQNEIVRLKILTNGLIRWVEGLNRWTRWTVRLTDRLNEIITFSYRK